MEEGYILGNQDCEITGLQTQAAFFEPITKQTLLKAGLKKDMSCIDIGCGSGSVTRLMADMVGDNGYVVGMGTLITDIYNIAIVLSPQCKI
jgi:SAM-dependent methyltransferase